MKKRICLLGCLAIIVSLTLTACNFDIMSMFKSKTDQTDAPVLETVEVPATEVETQKKINSVNDIVEMGGIKSGSNSLPRIKVKGDGADKINSELEKILSTAETYTYFKCDTYYYDGILSLVVNEGYDGGDNFNRVYVLDVNSGKQLSNAEVTNCVGLSEDDAFTKFEVKLTKQYYSDYASVLTDDYADQCIERTFSDENISEAQFYIDSQGQLCASSKVFVPVGGEGPKAMTLVIQ